MKRGVYACLKNTARLLIEHLKVFFSLGKAIEGASRCH